MATTPHILAVGNLVWETTAVFRVLPDPVLLAERGVGRTLEEATEVVSDGGGSAANMCVRAARLGLQAVLVGRAGDDPEGRMAVAALRAAGVDARVTLVPGRRTKRSFILKEAGTDRGTFHVEAPHKLVPPITQEEVPDSLLYSAAVLHLDRVSETALALAGRRFRVAAPVTLDLHTCPHRPIARERLEALVPMLAVAQLSEAAARAVAVHRDWLAEAGAVARALSEWIPWVVVTRGSKGAVASERGAEPWLVPPHPPRAVVDSTGAGDAFAAVLVRGYLGGARLSDTARAAAVLAARVCEGLGARCHAGD